MDVCTVSANRCILNFRNWATNLNASGAFCATGPPAEPRVLAQCPTFECNLFLSNLLIIGNVDSSADLVSMAYLSKH